MPKLRLGINNGFAAKRWPEPDAWATIIEQQLNLQNVQFSFDLLDPLMPEPLRSALCTTTKDVATTHGLSINSCFSGLKAYMDNLLLHPNPMVRYHGIRWYEEAIRVGSFLGAEGTGGFLGSMSIDDYRSEDRRKHMAGVLLEGINHLSHLCAQYGQGVFLWEMMPSELEMPHSLDEARDLLTRANEDSEVPIGLCFDLGHCCAPDLDDTVNVYSWLSELLPWTYVVHLQQTDGKNDRHWPFTEEFNRLGCIDPKRIVEIVASSPLLQVDLVLEICHPWEARPSTVLDDLKRSVDAFAPLL